MPRDCSHLQPLPKAQLGQGRECRERDTILVFLSAETLHYHDDKVRRVLAAIEDIICLDGGLDIVVEGSVVKHFPVLIDLVKHVVLDIVAMSLQRYHLPN